MSCRETIPAITEKFRKRPVPPDPGILLEGFQKILQQDHRDLAGSNRVSQGNEHRMIRLPQRTIHQPLPPFPDPFPAAAGELLLIGKIVGGSGEGVDTVQVFPPPPGQQPGADRKILVMVPGDSLAKPEGGIELFGRVKQGRDLPPMVTSTRRRCQSPETGTFHNGGEPPVEGYPAVIG